MSVPQLRVLEADADTHSMIASPESVLADFDGMPLVLSPRMLAEILDVSVKTLERWRAMPGGNGLRWHKLPASSLIRYYRADVITWLHGCEGAS